MRSIEVVRNGAQHAWDSVRDGWHHLRDLATHALTRFTPQRHGKGGEVETVADQIALASARWGLLTTEVQETDEAVIVRLEAPGMEADDFDIDVVDNRLVVRGEKQVESDRQRGDFHIMECAYGRFQRAIPLPTAVDESKAEAVYKRGVLRVTLPKVNGNQRRRIKVKH